MAGAPHLRGIRASFGRQELMKHLGARLLRLEPGDVWIGLRFRKELTQQHGFIHAGVLTAIADSACGYTAATLSPAGTEVLTVEYKVNFLSPASGPRLVARARALRHGRRLTVCAADVYSGSGREETLVATMLATIATKSTTRNGTAPSVSQSGSRSRPSRRRPAPP